MNDESNTRDERIAEAARELVNPPPATPRAEMWQVIRARLDETTGTVAEPDVTPLHGRSRRSGIGWWVWIAAALVIGLGIGRLTTTNGPDATSAARMAEQPGTSPVNAESMAGSPREREADSAVVATDRPEDTVATVAGGMDEQGPREVAPPPDAAMQDRSDSERAPRPGDGTGERGGRENVAYAVAARRHLDRSESLLMGVRTALEAGEPEPQFETWARSLLSRTRLLLGSPAARDPATRRLLEDLELMLVQIVFTTATGDPGEERILGEGLQDGDLLYRLRSATRDEIRPADDRAAPTSSL